MQHPPRRPRFRLRLTRRRRLARRTKILLMAAYWLVLLVAAYLIDGWGLFAMVLSTMAVLGVVHGLVVLATAILMARP
jgi:uncharacterized membrane protein (DUF485 family)